MYNSVADLEKEYYPTFASIYKSKNLIVKRIGSEYGIFYKHYIIMFYNRDINKNLDNIIKTTAHIYDMNKALVSTEEKDYILISFQNNKYSLFSFYIDIENNKVLPSSETKIQEAFDKIKCLKVFY